MKTVIILACAILMATASEELWDQFKIKHGKTYTTEEEHSLRYKIFTQNLADIEEHNKQYEQGLVSWYKAVNQFSDMTPEEFKATLTLTEFNQTGKAPLHVVNKVNIPDSIDWRQYGVVTGVKNQGNCGSCWSFSATGTLEGIYARQRGQLISFSEQNLIDCATESSGYSCMGCNGGVIQSALDYVRDHGITTEDRYSYQGNQGSCNVGDIYLRTSGYTGIGYKDENALKDAVGSVGPVSVAVNADPLQSYGGGVLNVQCSDSINHGVLAVGYGQQDGLNYWLVKNSWGDGWGESGYYKMAIGSNMCGIANQACYPNL
ncbi:cathepsin L-like [Rhynchophorus ferrugineus]|uniref:cathepsin L-like n=1 Tax=Rhynchophorus ferrugineus TaxID=354439 RepID=UPI003FCE7354